MANNQGSYFTVEGGERVFGIQHEDVLYELDQNNNFTNFQEAMEYVKSDRNTKRQFTVHTVYIIKD